MEMTPSVFVVDEDPLGRSVIRESASALNLHCEEYASGVEFFEGFDPARPGCVVLEIRIPGVSGLEIQQRLAADAPETTVLFVTRQATVSAAVCAMRAGAVHVLEKPVRDVELWEALQEAIRLNGLRRQVAHKRQEAQAKIARLTPKEWGVMREVSSGVSNAEIAAKFGVCQRTIELRRAKMMRKLHVGSLAELVRLVMAAENGRLPDLPSRELVSTPADVGQWFPGESKGGNGAQGGLQIGAGSQ
jgi:FixJ family two-component response regulator